MKRLPKLFLVLAVPALVIGLIVTFSDIKFGPEWTIAFPLGVICLGLFAISFLLQNEAAKFDEEQRQKIESANLASDSESGESHSAHSPPHPELVPAHPR